MIYYNSFIQLNKNSAISFLFCNIRFNLCYNFTIIYQYFHCDWTLLTKLNYGIIFFIEVLSIRLQTQTWQFYRADTMETKTPDIIS